MRYGINYIDLGTVVSGTTKLDATTITRLESGKPCYITLTYGGVNARGFATFIGDGIVLTTGGVVGGSGVFAVYHIGWADDGTVTVTECGTATAVNKRTK